MPSISRCGLPSIRKRSLKLPGSISSPLQTTCLTAGASAPIGTKLHLRPVAYPAPPRPRSPASLTSCVTSTGVISARAVRSAA